MGRTGRRAIGLRTCGAGLALVLLAAGAVPQAQAGYEERRTFRAEQLVVRNLIGEVRVAGHEGPEFEVRIRIEGRDATDAAGLKIVAQDGARGELTIRFPKAKEFVYPRLGGGSRTTLSPEHGQRSWLGELLGGLLGDRITVRGRGSGLEIWSDLEIRVPAGRALQVLHGVGAIEVADVQATLELDVQSGSVRASRARGELRVDTGSGHVELDDVDGALWVDTGSGHVEVRNARGRDARIDTGSGHVELDRVDFPHLLVDTGSGHVRATRVRTDGMKVDTGSGAVRLQLDRMGGGTYVVDTGSGRVELLVPRDASLDVRAETSSGGIDVDLDAEIMLRRKERDEVEFVVGDGTARVRIDTGSGGVRIAYGD